ncbi:MAG: pseudouridine synthase [Oscillospiraceae bacterium]
MRIDKFFSSQEILSRREVDLYIKSGRIKVNGEKIKKSAQNINENNDIITLDDNPIIYKPYIYIMLNKPQGVVSATDDKINKTVLDLVPPNLYRSDLFPAGRLDKDSVGFVLLTNDGDFAHKMLAPKSKVSKTYNVRLDAKISQKEILTVENGVTLVDGTKLKPCSVKLLEDTDTPLLEVIIIEGKYHQIKRMFGVVDKGVNYLKRVAIGNMKLDENLAESECKEILHKDLILIL